MFGREKERERDAGGEGNEKFCEISQTSKSVLFAKWHGNDMLKQIIESITVYELIEWASDFGGTHERRDKM